MIEGFFNFLIPGTYAASGDLVSAIDGVAGGAVDTVSELLSGDFGKIVYTLIAFSILGLIIYFIRKFVSR